MSLSRKIATFILAALSISISFLSLGASASAQANSVQIEAPSIVFLAEKVDVTIHFTDDNNSGQAYRLSAGNVDYSVDSMSVAITAPDEWGVVDLTLTDATGRIIAEDKIAVIPAWTSLVPPFLALAIAILTRSILPALFIGLWGGVWLSLGGGFSNIGLSLMTAFETNLIAALYDRDRLMILAFTMMIGGFIGLVQGNRGLSGLLGTLKGLTTSARRGQVAICSLGFIFFFDGTSNALLIGKTMQPVADRLRISREKLAYLVDSTAAPIAGLAFATSWIGYEVSLIASVGSGLEGFPENAYSVFLQSLSFSFYSILTIILVWIVALSGRDFGPMLRAEKAARRSAKEQAPDRETKSTNHDFLNALIPIAVLLVTLLSVMWASGQGETIAQRIGTADSFKALMWASFLACVSAAIMGRIRGVRNLEGIMDDWLGGVQTTLFALIILALSWCVADVTRELRAADFLVSFIGGDISIVVLPAIVFIIAGITAFSTGTSWGTMAILIPLALPLVWVNAAQDDSLYYFVPAIIAAIVNGATFGDHCSPISDTTIISSIASGCDHLEHVKTQAPYAVLVAVLAFSCFIASGIGIAWWINFIISVLGLLLFMKYFAKHSDVGD